MEEQAIFVREFDAKRNCLGSEAVERMCEVGPSGKVSLSTDLLGDPMCRVRHCPAFHMLVAETSGLEKVIVGLIRGCVKTVTCGKKAPRHGSAAAQKHPTPIYTKVGYILGLRVSPSYRRMGIGVRLVRGMEEWFRELGAEYSYMATDKDNEASVRLFTGRCGYSKFRTPSILVQPVFAHRLPLSCLATIISLSAREAESLYRANFSCVEFFPRDIDVVLSNPLSLGTFLAVPKTWAWSGVESFLADPPESWAVLSVWNCKDVFRLEVRGAPMLARWLAWASRAADRAMPWLRIPSMPNLFKPFGLYLSYGIGGEGEEGGNMVRALCWHAHNMAREGGCGVVAAEVGACDPLRAGIPHWARLSFAEDLWCAKRLAEDYSDGALGDWTKSSPGPSLFVDPREF